MIHHPFFTLLFQPGLASHANRKSASRPREPDHIAFLCTRLELRVLRANECRFADRARENPASNEIVGTPPEGGRFAPKTRDLEREWQGWKNA
jgi:hypothetical protein